MRFFIKRNKKGIKTNTMFHQKIDVERTTMTEYKCTHCGIIFDSTVSDTLKPLCRGCKYSKFSPSEKKISTEPLDSLRGLDHSIKSIYKKMIIIDDDEVKSYLREHIILKLINNSEVSFRDYFTYWAGLYSRNLTTLFPNKKPKENEKSFEDRKKKSFKKWDEQEQKNVKYDSTPNVVKVLESPDDRRKEKMIATTLNFQNLESVNRIFSILLEFDFFAVIKKWGEITGELELEKNWIYIEKMMRLRNDLSHTGKKIKITDYELQNYIHLTNLLLTTSANIFRMYHDWDNSPDESDELYVEFYDIFKDNYGISYVQAGSIFESCMIKE